MLTLARRRELAETIALVDTDAIAEHNAPRRCAAPAAGRARPDAVRRRHRARARSSCWSAVPPATCPPFGTMRIAAPRMAARGPARGGSRHAPQPVAGAPRGTDRGVRRAARREQRRGAAAHAVGVRRVRRASAAAEPSRDARARGFGRRARCAASHHRYDELWTESQDVANLSTEQRYHPRSFRSTHVSVENLGARCVARGLPADRGARTGTGSRSDRLTLFLGPFFPREAEGPLFFRRGRGNARPASRDPKFTWGCERSGTRSEADPLV